MNIPRQNNNTDTQKKTMTMNVEACRKQIKEIFKSKHLDYLVLTELFQSLTSIVATAAAATDGDDGKDENLWCLGEVENWLGYCHLNGMQCEKDSDEGLQWFHRAADRGCEIAMHNVGDIYWTRKQIPLALEWYDRLTIAEPVLMVARLLIDHYYFCPAKRLLERIRINDGGGTTITTTIRSSIDESMLTEFHYLLGRVLSHQSTCVCCGNCFVPADLTRY